MADKTLFILTTESHLSDEAKHRLSDAFSRVSDLPAIVADGGMRVQMESVPGFRFAEFILGVGSGVSAALFIGKAIGLF